MLGLPGPHQLGRRSEPLGSVIRVRDDFSAATRRTLAARAGHRCSNPDCRAVTSGPGSNPYEAVNLGMAAHITAASPEGPRYDPALTKEQRASIANGIWACPTCGTLIDSDAPGYTPELLERWKREAEDLARRMLIARTGHVTDHLDLAMPSVESADSLLSFASTSIAHIGRDTELAELIAFLENDDRAFSWWLWTGPAGAGKSRLAIELCRFVNDAWHGGFLRDANQERLGDLRVVTPTLVIVDYAAQRSAWLSDALFQLTQHDPGAPVRVLVLEREAAGPWWDDIQRLHRSEEASLVAAARYGLPRELTGLIRDDLRKLIRQVAQELGAALTMTDVEDIADHADHIDPRGSPLFGYVATIDWLNSQGVSTGRDDALRRLIARAETQVARRIVEPTAVIQARNVRFLSSTLGGLNVEKYADLLQKSEPPVGLLPGAFSPLPQVTFEELFDGLRPDILGELFVLDRLRAGGTDRFAATKLLEAAWLAAPEAYKAFVARTTADHCDHPNLVDLFNVEGDSPPSWAWLAVDSLPLLRRSDHPLIAAIFTRLTAYEAAPDVDEAIATARFRFANLVLNEEDAGRANELFTDALAYSQPAWPVYASMLNNRGITWLRLDRPDLAIADFTAVIEATTASDEARACALNNRADVYEPEDITAAVADRTAVLALANTTYDRRYIALARRARALQSRGDETGAQRDLESILEKPDIAVEQKMEARLQRAALHIGAGRRLDALSDLTAIVHSFRNFAHVEEKAKALLNELEPRVLGGVQEP
jgi:hypothetical protein